MGLSGRTLRVSLFLLLCMACGSGVAAPVAFQWLELPEGDLSIEQVRSVPDSQWQSIDAGGILNRGFSDGVFWLKVPVSQRPVNRVLEISYPLLDVVSLHWEIGGRIVETHHTGDTRPFDSRPIVHRNFVFLVPSLTEPVTAWIRIRTQGSVQIPVSVTSSAEFLAHEQISFGWQAMFVGIVFSLALYNLFLFAIVRHTTYLWYVLAVITTGLVQLNFNGLLFQWLWSDAPKVNDYFTVPIVAIALVFALTFTMKFLSIRRYSLWSYRLLQVLRLVGVTMVIYGFVGAYQSGIAMVSALAALVTITAWCIGVLVWRKGQVLAGFYVLAWTPLLVGHLVLAISKLGWIPRSGFTELAPQAGVAMEVILLSFALAYRINLERQRRQQAQEHALEVQQQANLTLESRVQERTLELEKANEQLKAISLTDGLTHVANRRRFDEKLDIEWNRALRHEQVLSLVLLDIDHFKRVNDTLGHLVGDDCLVSLADVLKSEIQRSGDLVARYGGEEFVILLPATDTEGARLVAERLRQAVARTPVYTGDDMKPVSLTISVGVASMSPTKDSSSQELMRHADEALYAAKAGGRNRVVVWSEDQLAPTTHA